MMALSAISKNKLVALVDTNDNEDFNCFLSILLKTFIENSDGLYQEY